MTFIIAHRLEVKKIVQAVVIDTRKSLALAGKDGNVVQPYVDAEAASIGTGPFYAIETEGGSLCGYFSLTVTGTSATLKKKNYRLQYSASYLQFNNMIDTFIASGNWRFDTL